MASILDVDIQYSRLLIIILDNLVYLNFWFKETFSWKKANSPALLGVAGSAIGGFGHRAQARRQMLKICGACREVKLLDDMCKTAIVLITQHYVHESSDMLPARLSGPFAGMHEKDGTVRLLTPAANRSTRHRPQDDLSRGIAAPWRQALLRAGAHDGKHPHGRHADSGGHGEMHDVPRELLRKKVIGALGYTLP
jgi:hypothetical protein